MMTKTLLKRALMLLLVSIGFNSFAQTLKGRVTEAATKTGLPAVSVSVVGKPIGTSTDGNGDYSLNLGNGTYQIRISFIGFATVTKSVTIAGSPVTFDVALDAEATALQEVVVSVGSRNSQRTVTDSPLPISIFSTRELQSTGQTTFDKALQYRVPSFNTVNTPVNDATTLLDPYELRNLGPSRTLILINGKRKNLSSLLYVQFSPGRGETGVDLSAIPTEAIKRVEVLSDGASAQYGSDAIAGVMNVILKDRYEYSSLNITSGVTSAGDGGMYGVSFNGGANFGKAGFVNYTTAFSQQNSAVRSGTIDVPTEIATFGGDATSNAAIKSYLQRFPTANNINGTGETTAAKFLINAGIPIGETAQLYGNAAYVAKKVNSYANYRPNYWKQDYGLLHAAGTEYLGYVPTFEGDLTDYNATIGIKDEKNGWKQDISFTIGGNQQLYTVNNTVNHSLQAASPISFKTGGYNFSHVVGNVDFSKEVTKDFNIGFGSEIRNETYRIIAGDTASYSGQGANSFPGISAANATTNSRFNLGAYLDLSYDINKSFLINATARAENYSDFGGAFVWKASSRYKFLDDKIVLRASASTGFRAPSMQQIYNQSTQASFVGGFIQLSGLFNNKSKQAAALGIPALKPEKSNNFTVGVGLNPVKNLSITLDYYNIDISDRIVYSSSIASSSTTSVLGKILAQGGIKTISFFINGIKTNTQGLDYVVSYRNIAAGSGKITLNLSGNITLNNEIIGSPNDPAAIKADGQSILSTQIRSLLTESRPKYKTILGIDYVIGKFQANLNNTLFGPTSFQDLDNGGSIMEHIKQTFSPAVVTDLNVGYNFSKSIYGAITVSNLFNVLPSWKLVALDATGSAYLNDTKIDASNGGTNKELLEGFLEFSGRYRILGYNGSQFSQLGTIFNANVNIKF